MENLNEIKTVIAEDVEIMGSVKCSGNIRIDGRLNGDLTCGSKAVIGETAHVKGNLSAEAVTVAGHINGNINAKDKIELKATANVNGDLRGRRLTVVDGVTYIGKAEINPSGGGARQPSAGESKPSADAAAIAADSNDDDSRKSGLFNRK